MWRNAPAPCSAGWGETEMWIAAERREDARLLWPALEVAVAQPIPLPAREASVLPGTEYRPAQPLSPREGAATALVQGWLQLLGPLTAQSLGAHLQLDPALLHQALLVMEMQGLAMRGVYERARPAEDVPFDTEWCERRILQRIHRLTLSGLRRSVEPVSPAVFNRWLQDWHHVAPESQLNGEEGVLAALEQLEGFEAPAVEWERTLLPARVAGYNPQWLDSLCLAGIVGWGRISPHPAGSGEDGGAPRRVIPTGAAPITFFLREAAEWLPDALASKCVDAALLTEALSPEAQKLRSLLGMRGAAFSADLQRLSGFTKQQVMCGLWELATAGLASADGFDQLRALMDPRRKSVHLEQTPAVSLRKRAAARTTAGRWSLLCEEPQTDLLHDPRAAAVARARQQQAALEAHARVLLGRYGVLFRELLQREANAPKWRDLVPVLRRLEARGEIRGGRFVSGPFGEQFAISEAVEALREARRRHLARSTEAPITIAAADPLNLAGILVPGERVAAIPGRSLAFLNGAVAAPADEATQQVTHGPTAQLTSGARKPVRRAPSRSVVELLRGEGVRTGTGNAVEPQRNLGLFS